ncbi:hypothetical protein ES703_96140 [subsurface metagenome]
MSGTAIYPVQSPDPLGGKEKSFMKVPDEQVLHKVKQWLINGDEDLRLASSDINNLKPIDAINL